MQKCAWHFQHSHMSNMDTTEILECLSFLGSNQQPITQSRKLIYQTIIEFKNKKRVLKVVVG